WIVSSLEKAVEIYYLGENGSYSLKNVFVLDEDVSSPSYNGEQEISLKAFPHVHLRLKEIFENL
ncbi:MAG TPA: Uma2 family endonuclease, partial [Candidatus Blautia merdipullorum]|nr:Uma2 family endonuclease [Candidatus Blautia merdipullorum]